MISEMHSDEARNHKKDCKRKKNTHIPYKMYGLHTKAFVHTTTATLGSCRLLSKLSFVQLDCNGGRGRRRRRRRRGRRGRRS